MACSCCAKPAALDGLTGSIVIAVRLEGAGAGVDDELPPHALRRQMMATVTTNLGRFPEIEEKAIGPSRACERRLTFEHRGRTHQQLEKIHILRTSHTATIAKLQVFDHYYSNRMITLI